MAEDFKSKKWQFRYCTSSLNTEGNPTDILHDFYLPALKRSVKYDRVAGYFRSSSLAAASQGYTAFLDNGGHMRLIVGADLQVQDVAAILAGNNQRLSDSLMKELDGADQWPEDVQNGVALLASMVASGQLEVRVAFRVNAETHTPLDADSIEDGYVHEKWFVMTDADGNRLYGSGSLNESRTALIRNAENIDIHCDWKGEDSFERVDNAEKDFTALWTNRNPHMAVYPIPTAVQQRLVRMKNIRNKPTEIDGTVLQVKVQPTVEEMLAFAVLKDAPKMPGGIYIGMYSAPVEPWPHQEIVSRKLIESWPYSYMMCDEVGLGKTIEAALAMRSLILSGRAKRVLIVAPASLTNQWQRELAQKACLPFNLSRVKPGYAKKIQHGVIYPSEDETVDEALFGPDLNIVSSGLVSRTDRVSQFNHEPGCDIILVDEAHYARRQNPRDGAAGIAKYGKLYRSMQNVLRGKAKGLWMATATPMQIDAIEVYDLFRLTRRVGAFQNDPTLSMWYFQLLGMLQNGKELTMQQWSMLGQNFAQLPALDPYLNENLQNTVVNGKNRKVLEKLPFGTPKHADIRHLVQPMFSASPLSRVMMRHTRQLLEIYRENGELTSNLAKRHVRPVCAVKFTQAEAKVYGMLTSYCDELSKQIHKNNKQSTQVMCFLLNFLQLRFASSIYAIKMTLSRRLQRVQNTLLIGAKTFDTQAELDDALAQIYDEDNDYNEGDLDNITLDALLKDRSKNDLEWENGKLKEMLALLNAMTETPSKMQTLLEELDRRRIGNRLRQTVLFTRFYDTLTSIRNCLGTRDPQMRVGIYAGGKAIWYNPQTGLDENSTHEEIKQLFLAGEIDLLLCTDAAAEGLNLQTADLLINFDMGWNPMKIEQRIGRIDRIGQKHNDIEVLNMCYLGSAEEIVYGRLLQRLNQANLVVGAQQISMLPVKEEEFKKIQDGTLTPEELEKLSIARLKQQRENTAKMEMSAEDQYDVYRRQSAQMRHRDYPADLDSLWCALTTSPYLSSQGAAVVSDGVWSMPSSEDFFYVSGTKDRDKVDGTNQFLTWGNEAVDHILSTMSSNLDSPDYKNCIQRISISELDTEFVGFMVCTQIGPKLITSIHQMKGVQIDTSGVLTTQDIQDGKNQLLAQAHDELLSIKQLVDVEQRNQEAALLQKKLVTYVAVALLQGALNAGAEKFTDAYKLIIQEQKKIHIIKLPISVFGGMASKLLFVINEANGEITVNATGLLWECAIELCLRTVSSLKNKKRSGIKSEDLKTEDVIRRISHR